MFEVDLAGLAEIEGGREPWRLACEPIANVFDEYRGYGFNPDRKKPTKCVVRVETSAPRGILLWVMDDGPGFERKEDIWTFFGRTSKRTETGVSGRFNAGDKQLIAAAKRATVITTIPLDPMPGIEVQFEDGERTVKRHKEPVIQGTAITALMNWRHSEFADLILMLRRIVPPEGLQLEINGIVMEQPVIKYQSRLALPSVKLNDGCLTRTMATGSVHVLQSTHPMLHELGIPVCSLEDIQFPWSLDVQQKVPVPPTRDMVDAAYLYQVIGKVLETAAMDGIKLLTEEQQGAGFVKRALDWVKRPEALAVTVKSLYGDNAVRQSNDSQANARAAASGATIIPGRNFSQETRSRLDNNQIMPTSHVVYGETRVMPESIASPGSVCPRCGRPL